MIYVGIRRNSGYLGSEQELKKKIAEQYECVMVYIFGEVTYLHPLESPYNQQRDIGIFRP